MPQYHAEVLIYGTVYVNARDEEHARMLIAEHYGTADDPACFHLARDLSSETDGVFLSAAMTSYGIEPAGWIDVVPGSDDGED